VHTLLSQEGLPVERCSDAPHWWRQMHNCRDTGQEVAAELKQESPAASWRRHVHQQCRPESVLKSITGVYRVCSRIPFRFGAPETGLVAKQALLLGFVLPEVQRLSLQQRKRSLGIGSSASAANPHWIAGECCARRHWPEAQGLQGAVQAALQGGLQEGGSGCGKAHRLCIW